MILERPKLIALLRINLRVLVLMVLLLFLIDLGIGYKIRSIYAKPHNYRVENQDLTSLKNLIAEIKKAQGYKVVFIGDSATFGSTVKSASQTVPYYLGNKLIKEHPNRDIKVYNLALKGYGVGEAFFVLNALKETDIDLVIYNLSLSWLNREAVLDHPRVVELSQDFYKSKELERLGVDFSPDDESLEKALQNQVEGYWQLYRHKHLLNYSLMGKTLSQQLQDIKLYLTDRPKLNRQRQEERELFLPWEAKEWASKYEGVTWKFGEINLSDKNHQLSFYKLFVDLLEAENIPSIIYTTPQNFKLLETYNILNREAVSKSISALERTTTGTAEIRFLNYIDKVSPTHFSDSVHLLPKGNERVGELLAEELARLNLIGE